MFKRRLDLDGKPIAEPVKHEIGEQDANATTFASDKKEEGMLKFSGGRDFKLFITLVPQVL